MHGSEGAGVELGPGPEKELAGAGLGVEQERGARLPVVVEGHHPRRLVVVHRQPGQVAVVQRRRLAPLALEVVVEEGDLHPVEHVGHRQQLAGAPPQDRAAEVDLGMGVDVGLLGGGDVEADQAGEVAAPGRAHPQCGPVGREAVDAALVLVGVDGEGAELLVLAGPHEDLVVALGRLGRRRQQVAGRVGVPAGDVAGVLGHQLQRPGDEVEAVDVEALGIPLVHRDQQGGGVGIGDVDDPRPHALERRQVHRHVLGPAEVGGVDVEVLVAALVLGVQDAGGVAAPEVAADAAGVVMGDTDVVVGPHRAHPHVQAVVLRGQVRQPGAVGADLAAGLLGVLEEVLDGYERRRIAAGVVGQG